MLSRGTRTRRRLFDPRKGTDLGNSVPTGIWLVSSLIDLHDNLLAGRTGRKVNGVGASAPRSRWPMTGIGIWWRASRHGARGLSTASRRWGWKRLTWDLLSMIGFWAGIPCDFWPENGFILSLPRKADSDFHSAAWASPLCNAGVPSSTDDHWLAYLHFSRIEDLEERSLSRPGSS